MPDPLPEDLRCALHTSADRRGSFGEPIVFFLETGSTNDVAAALAEKGAPQGTTVVAWAQTAGRGRRGREWFSPAGAGVYASVVCRSPRAFPFLTLAAGVAVAEGIRRATSLPVSIKWPNDIVVTDRRAPGGWRKLAGVLAEASTGAEGLQYVVLGVGINTGRASYPPAVAGSASSLEAELGRAVDPGIVLAETLAGLNEQITALEKGDSGLVLGRWSALAPSSAGSVVEWSAQGRTHRGTTSGIDDTGALLVQIGRRLERIVAGEVRWVAGPMSQLPIPK